MPFTKQDIIKLWKPELKSLGFKFQDGMFWHEQSGTLRLGVSIQKNIHNENFKINPTVILLNPLLKDSSPQVLLLGNLRKDGIYLHVNNSSWWPGESALAAAQYLGQYAFSWFQKYAKPDYLAHAAETAIREHKSLIEILEPLNAYAAALTSAPAPPQLLYFASVLHYLNGDKGKAIERTNDWLNSLSRSDVDTRRIAMNQLSSIRSSS